MILNYEEGDVFGPGEVESTGPLMWEPDHVVAGKPAPAPRKPVKKPMKKPRQPVFLGEWQQESAALGEQGKQHQATERQIDAAMSRGGAFQGGLASGQQSVQPKLKTPLKRGYAKVQQGATSKVVSPTGLPVSEGTYAQDVENRHPDVAQMWPSDSKEVARLDEIARLSQPGFGPAMDRGMLRSNETLKNFGAGALSLIDDLGKAIHPTNFVGGDSEGMVHAMARKLSASSQDDAATIGGVSAQYGSPAEYLTEVSRGLPGMLGSVYLSTQMTGNPALGFAVQKMAEARGHGITDPKELAREGLIGLGEGQLFHMVGGMQGGLGRIATQGALGAAQPIGESLARGQGLPNAQTMIEGGLTNAILDMVPGMGGGIDHPAKAAKAMEALPIAEQLEVGDALADPSPRSFASFRPTELQAMEQRALEAGKPIALRPETRDAYTARNQEIKGQLLTVDPTSPEFARLADEHARLARAIDDAPEVLPQSAEELRQHLIQMNMGHEGAAQEMLDILRPPSGDSPLKLDIDKFQAARQSSLQGARFYPLNNETKGGSVYVTPQTFEDSGLIEKGQRSEVGAVNVPLDEAWNAAARLQESQPDVAAALVAAVKEAEAKGISKISVLSYAEGQGLGETRKLMRHESFHSGQQAAAEAADVMGIDVRDLHPPDLIYNPLLTKAAQTENGQGILKYYDGNLHDLALEMAAYSAADQHDYIGLSKEEAASYLTDYLTGIADQYGPEALDALAGTARLSPRVEQQVKEISSEAKPKKNFGQANRDFAAQLRSQPSASGGPQGSEGRSEGSSSVDEGRIAEGGDQDETERVAGGTVEGEGGGPPSENSAVKNGGPELFTTVLTSDVVKEYAKKSGEALRKLGLLDENSLLPPHEQILKILKERPDLAEPAAIGAALREQGVTGEETLKQIDEAAANAGRTLQAIQAADAQWTQIIKEHPEVAAELAKAGVGPKPEQIIKQGLKEIQASVLGRSLWRRSGDLYRKMLLTRFSTAANNAVSTMPRIPLDLIDGAMTGTAMGMLQPGKWAGKSDASLAEGAKAGALAGMQASIRVAMAFPDVARKLLRRETPAHDFNEMVISQMEQLHPDLHSKLEGRSTGLDEFKKSSVKLDTIRDLLPYLNDATKIKEYNAKLDMYQKRYDFNHKLAGKLFDKSNWVYDQFLKPGNVQEFFFRRPYFVGALANRAAAAGFDLSELATNARTLKDFAADPKGKDAQAIMQLRTLADLPAEVWEAAADDALTFTYAYNPHRDQGRVEKFASHYIEFMDSLGPVGAVVDAFPKAVYNGLKFAYEYGPIGMIKPVANIIDNVYQSGGRNGIEYNDVSRISKALLGTAMYATAIGIRKELGGEEWWQIKTGKKNAKGEPEYLNVKKWMPFAGFLYVADLILRMKNGRMIDKKPGDDMAELYLGARRADSGGTVFSESIKEVADYWASGDPLDDTLLNKAGKPLGNILGAPLTPLINLRDLIAQFDEDEAARRDMKESPFLGPAIDRIPWLRSSEKYGLPLYQPPTELAPRPASSQPALTLGGVAMDPGSNFATREFSRLGLSPVRWLRPDPDPLINRAQYAAYAEILQELGPALEADSTYKVASDAEKGAMWEQLLSGPEGYASMAKAQGELANPEEIQRRELLKTQGPLQRKASGLEKEVKEMKKQAQPRP